MLSRGMSRSVFIFTLSPCEEKKDKKGIDKKKVMGYIAKSAVGTLVFEN
jgi:hypothetical protein